MNKLVIESEDFSVSKETDGTESDLWKKVAEELLNVKTIPSKINVTYEGNRATLNIKKRGNFKRFSRVKNWNYDAARVGNLLVYPSMYVTCDENTIKTKSSEYDECYLTDVCPEGNNYKFYRMIPNNNRKEIDVIYGSIDESTCAPRHVNDPYDSFLYWVRYYEKLSKGYEDKTNEYIRAKAESKRQKESGSPKCLTTNQILYKKLYEYANKKVESYGINRLFVNENALKEAKKEFNKMCSMKTVRGFNNHLVKLMAISPRETGDRTQANYLLSQIAQSVSDFPRIIDREENLIFSIEAVLKNDILKDSRKNSSYPSFRDNDIMVFTVNDRQKAEVLSYLPQSLHSRVKEIYRVKPLEQEKRFSDYCKRNNIKTIKKLWHGSVNSNWASIIENSLQIRPQVANGRMFGNGLYFANSALKSWNYTSIYGSTWARGTSSTGFMGLYATAYGNPWFVCGYGGKYTNSSVKNNGYDCVHATSQNTGLRADEIIFYDNDAICLNYIVEFE